MVGSRPCRNLANSARRPPACPSPTSRRRSSPNPAIRSRRSGSSISSRGCSVAGRSPLAAIVDRLNATHLDWLFEPRVVADALIQLQANWLADYRNSSGIVLEDGRGAATLTIEDSSRVDPWIARQAQRLADACREALARVQPARSAVRRGLDRARALSGALGGASDRSERSLRRRLVPAEQSARKAAIGRLEQAVRRAVRLAARPRSGRPAVSGRPSGWASAGVAARLHEPQLVHERGQSHPEARGERPSASPTRARTSRCRPHIPPGVSGPSRIASARNRPTAWLSANTSNSSEVSSGSGAPALPGAVTGRAS